MGVFRSDPFIYCSVNDREQSQRPLVNCLKSQIKELLGELDQFLFSTINKSHAVFKYIIDKTNFGSQGLVSVDPQGYSIYFQE